MAAARDCLAPGLSTMRREALRVLHLDAAHRVIGVRLHYSRDRSAIALPLRTIVADALSLGSAGLLLAHNHPSGDARPSADDVAATWMLAQVMAPLGVTVHDHLVVAGAGITSMRALDLIEPAIAAPARAC